MIGWCGRYISSKADNVLKMNSVHLIAVSVYVYPFIGFVILILLLFELGAY